MHSHQDDPGVGRMLAYQAGDEDAFDALVRDYSGQVFTLLTRFLGPCQGREDLVQEVFLRVIRARRRYRPTARFSTWLYRIVFNLCVNEGQRASSRGHVSLEALVGAGEGRERTGELADEDAPDPSRNLEREDVVGAVRAAIACLPPNQRLALVLAKYENMPYSEIAQVLDSSEKAVKSLVHRARETLRERLSPFLQEDPA